MLPELFTIGPLTLHTYGLLVALGILSGVVLAEYLNRKMGGEPGQIVDMALVVVLSGLLGSRLLFIFVNLGYYLANPLEILMIWKGGLVFYGALLGGILGLVVYVRLAGMALWRTLDITAPAVALAHAMGRVGCFSAGCCFGRETDLPWAVTFTDPACLATEVLGIPVHPTQLYSAAFLGLLATFLVWFSFRKGFEGQITALYLGAYGAFRFGVEFFRGDPRGSINIVATTFSTSQIISLLMVGSALLIYSIRRHRRD